MSRQAIAVGSAVAHTVSESRKLSPVVMDPCPEQLLRKKRPRPLRPFCSSTYVSIRNTCPDTCGLKDNGCYAQTGFTASAIRKMDLRGRRGVRRDPDQPMIDEARAIDAMYQRGVPQDGGRDGKSRRDLRLHVSGDVTSEIGARILARAAERWQARGGGTVWTYTHRWRDIPREAWGPINVLASVETLSDGLQAIELGYAVAITVPKLPEESADGRSASVSGNTAWSRKRWRMVPCPFESRGVTCVKCRLCLDRDLVKLRIAVVFKFHGPKGGKHMSQMKLPVVR